MKIYVAAPFNHFKRARRMMADLRAAGHVISHDWTKEADKFPTDEAPEELKQLHALADMHGVYSADAVVALTTDDKTEGHGMWWEAGGGLILGKLVIISGSQRNRSVFGRLCIRVEHDGLVLPALLAHMAHNEEEPGRQFSSLESRSLTRAYFELQQAKAAVAAAEHRIEIAKRWIHNTDTLVAAEKTK